MPNKKNERDYGYYGKGTNGYIHYKRDFDRNFPSNKQRGYYVPGRPSDHPFQDLFFIMLGLAMIAVAPFAWLMMMYFFALLLP